MCDECGCGESTDKKAVDRKDVVVDIVDRSINEANDAVARQTSHILEEKGILCVNIMGAPGSGKTSAIEGISSFLGNSSIAVIQGDLESDVDKRRLEAKNISAHQINTHSGCHLNASMINKALMDMDLKGKEYLLVENVGNLVCPAGVKLGQHMNIVISSTAEGSDKPRKYPHIFRDADLVVISKQDLAGHVDFDEKRFISDIGKIHEKKKIISCSSKDPGSFKAIAYNIKHRRAHLLDHDHDH